MCIHRMKIVHRDLKSANCLVNKHWTAKICDFGLSRIMTESPMRDSSSAGTPEWMAPELIRNEPFTEKCDIFSLGVIIWELCTLSRPWNGVPPEKVSWPHNLLVTFRLLFLLLPFRGICRTNKEILFTHSNLEDNSKLGILILLYGLRLYIQ